MAKYSSLFLFALLNFHFAYSQNIGIGTNIPAFKLDVKNGSINTDSFYRIRSIAVLNAPDPGNLFIGPAAGYSNTGSYNTFSGNAAGLTNSTGTYNSFFGFHSGFLNTYGNSNSFFGGSAGANNQVGNYNSFFGQEAGYNNYSASNNTLIGFMAGRSIGDDGNTMIGALAGYSTTSPANVFIGYQSAYSNTDGWGSVIIGYKAGFYNTTGKGNCFFGYEAGLGNITADHNSFFGTSAGFYNKGQSNSFFGYQAGYSNTTGFENTMVGDSAGHSNLGGIRNLFVGYAAGVNNTTGFGNCAIGADAGSLIETGNSITVVGTSANTLQSNLSNATALGFHAMVGCNNCMALGGTWANGDQTRVGINNPTPLTDLHIIQQTNANLNSGRGIRLQSPNGNHWRVFLDPGNNYVFQYNNGVYAYIEPVNGFFISSSDVRLKTSINPLSRVLDKLLLLEPKTYHYLASSNANRLSYGFIAQEVEKLFPDFVFKSEDGLKGIAYSNFSVIAVKAIQEQQVLIEDQKQKIDRLEQQMQAVLKELSELRAAKK